MESKKILVVDDDDDIRMIISLILQEEGYAVIELNNGRHVVDTVRAVHPDLILLDVMLGDADGRDICKDLKNVADTEIIPIIIISATHGWHTMHEKNCKANNYLNKPFDIADLVNQVKRYAA
ncbi:MAG: response regulator [Mucilaginibacter sp.]|nr:response regulator [Mucilaginibacter sp.]